MVELATISVTLTGVTVQLHSHGARDAMLSAAQMTMSVTMVEYVTVEIMVTRSTELVPAHQDTLATSVSTATKDEWRLNLVSVQQQTMADVG